MKRKNKYLLSQLSLFGTEIHLLPDINSVKNKIGTRDKSNYRIFKVKNNEIVRCDKRG